MFLVAENEKGEKVDINDAIIKEKYYCPFCHELLIVRKGKKRRHHFSHKKESTCSGYKYKNADMCEWHIKWQDEFPKECREVIKKSNGKTHIADILKDNIEIEFQHSYMSYEEFKDRNTFYTNLGYRVIWVFDENESFNNGYNGGTFYYSRKFDCFKNVTFMPDNVDIFVDGVVQENLFTKSGRFVYHVKEINGKGYLVFDAKYTKEEFLQNINNRVFANGRKLTVANKLANIVKENINADRLFVYNQKTNYVIYLDKYNINRFLNGSTFRGKIKRGDNYSNFNSGWEKIYYTEEPVWVYLNHYE